MTTAEEMRNRTKKFAYRIIRLFRSLPKGPEAQIIGKQLFRSGTSVAANYRAAGRARTHPEFTAKIGTVLEECDESLFWLECLADNGIVRQELLADLIDEATQLTKIFSASQQTAKAKEASEAN